MPARFFGVNPLSMTARQHYSSALSELETAVALAALGADWCVAHSTRSATNRINTDHIVLGPPGVFLVCSRQHPLAKIVTAGRMIMVNGRRVAYVRDALIGADRLAEELADLGADHIGVRPVVTIGGASGVIYGNKRPPVPVLQLGELVSWLLHEPPVHSVGEVNRLVATAARLESWHVLPAAGNANVRLTARFERLRAEVDAARQRYRLWLVAGGAAAIAATVTMLIVVGPSITELVTG
ncbi:hypothetical protein [Rhodoglobus sp.]